MRARLTSGLTYANVMATVAVFIALGGSSYAAFKLPKNAVKRANIAPNAVTSAKVKDRSLRKKDFALGQLPAGPKGDRGPAGPQGDPGRNGSPDTALDVRSKLVTVDGAGSGLDADLLDGQSTAAFQARVTGTCPHGSHVRAVAANGSVTCGITRAGVVQPNGSIFAGSGFTATRLGAGSYQINVPAGTYTDEPYIVPVVTPLFSANPPVINGFAVNVDGSLEMAVSFGADTYFAFALLSAS